jgi:uncharacterized membrane protein
MRGLFGLVGLLLVLVIVGLLVRKQMVPAKTAAPGLVIPAGTPAQQSQQTQQQFKQSLDAAMQQARPVPDDK